MSGPSADGTNAGTGGGAGGGAGGGSSIRAITFDWGGVFTVGTFDHRAASALAELHELQPDEVEPRYLTLMAEFEVGAFDLPEFHRRFQRAVGRTSDLRAFRRSFLTAAVERPAMYRLLASLPEGVAVGMLSNNVPELCDQVRSDPRMRRVEAFVFSNEIGVRKPDARAFQALTDAIGVPPEATVFVDDSPTNIAACASLGFTGLLLDDLASFASRWRETLPHLPLPPEFDEAAKMGG